MHGCSQPGLSIFIVLHEALIPHRSAKARLQWCREASGINRALAPADNAQGFIKRFLSHERGSLRASSGVPQALVPTASISLRPRRRAWDFLNFPPAFHAPFKIVFQLRRAWAMLKSIH